MFKPLLRTLPSLSGNFTLACKLNELKKESNNKYYTYVRVADLMPLQNNMFRKNIELNLLNGKYEHDVKKYYSVYSNVFYKDNFNFNKMNYKTLDIYSRYNETNDDRNKDYEFGCKRIYFSKIGYQFEFYAPFYLDDINDLPKSFHININIDNHTNKEIVVYINKENKINYLKHYFEKYFENVDDRVIFCLYDSLQAAYFGVDVKKGGFAQYRDNLFGSLYVNQTTINNFDNLICKGFERNNLIMKQIIPLSFIFNINDLFSNYEKEFFNGYKMKITGFYYNKNDIKQDMYDFDINYFNSNHTYYKYNPKQGKYKYEAGNDGNGIINVMNVGYPALRESKYTKYEFTNKISPNYCKFKMLLSDDDHPYITNVNFAYSYLQYPNQKYGSFPTTLKGIVPKLKYVNGDIKLPLGLNIDAYYKTSKYFANTIISNSVNYDKFIKLMDNYCSNWFNIYKNDHIQDAIDDENNWCDVIYDYAYFDGILYSLYKLKKYDISKFGVFLNYNIDYVSNNDLNNMINAKYVFSNSEPSTISIARFNNNYDMSIYDSLSDIKYYSKLFDNTVYNSNNAAYLHHDKIMEKDMYGSYVVEENYYDENKYYLLSDVLKIIDKSSYSPAIKTKLRKYFNTNKILGYIVLDACNNINFFETYFNIYGEKDLRLMLTNTLFETSNKDAQYEWLLNRLYYSTSASSSKIKLSTGYKNLNHNEEAFGKFCMYLEDTFINSYDVYFILSELSNDYEITDDVDSQYFRTFISLLNNQSNKFTFERIGSINGISIENYFLNINKQIDSQDIYVDPYNLKYLIKKYNKDNNDNLSLPNEKHDYFIKIINKDHLKEYYYNLNKDENCQSNIEYDNILEYIYVKERKWVIDNNVLSIKDVYSNLYTYIVKYILLYNETDNTLNDSLNYIYNMLNSDKDTVYNWIFSNLSDSRNTNNKFNLNISNAISLEVDLCFRKEVYKLDNNLFKLLTTDKEINNYLYLYIENDCTVDNYSSWDIIGSNYVSKYNSNIEYKEWENKKYSKELYEKEISNYLVPLFTDVYINDDNKNVLNNMIQLKKIDNNKYVNNLGKCFKEIDIDEMLNNLYCDKSYIVNELYYNLTHARIPNDLTETVQYLISNAPKPLYSLLVKYFGSKIVTNTMSKRQYINLLSEGDMEMINKYFDDLVTDTLDIAQNKNAQKSLDVFMQKCAQRFNLDYNVYESFMNEYCIDNNIDLDTISANELVKHKLSYIKDKSIEAYYTLIKENGITLYSMKDTLELSFNGLSCDCDNLIYDDEYKLYIYDKDGVKYAFYFISLNIDNTNYSFNILDDYNLNVKFDTINSYNVNDKSFINSVFPVLYPFLKINVFGEFIKKANLISYPNELEIYIKYVCGNTLTIDEAKKYVKLITNENDILYDSLQELKTYKKIKLLRYFNYITPLLKKTNIIYDDWYLKFMESNPKHNDIEKYNILDRRNTNIYKYSPLTVYGITDYNIYEYKFNNLIDQNSGETLPNSYEISQIEYKHYNDNLVYNLPEHIVIYDKTIYNETTLNNLLKEDENLTEKKINIIYNFFRKNGLDYNDIKLFLYNKYESSFFIEKADGECKIKYTFNLI